jgi:heme exporter protein B
MAQSNPQPRSPGSSEPPGFFVTLWRIYRKDTALEWKSPAGLVSLLLFSLVLVAVYHYAMDDSVFRATRNLNGIMLATLFFASTIQSGRNIHAETEAGALRVALMAPADASGYYLGKVLSIWQSKLIFIALYIPLYQLFLTGLIGANAAAFGVPFVGLSLAALSLAALGVMLAYIARGSRLKEILFPLLLLPAALPVFILTVDFLQNAQAATATVGLAALPLRAMAPLVGPAGLYCAVGSLLYYAMASEE